MSRGDANTTRTTPELLAPAGGFEQLSSAIHFGADAVYLGGQLFGLRKRADNFCDQDIAAAVAMAHGAGVKVHVTVNSLVHQDDLEALVPYLHLVADSGADAIIAGDLATIALARREVPSLAVHASTQLSCANSQAALVLAGLGCSRIVLARELTLGEIAAMRKALPAELELEAFVHGAMCMAYSGRCIISNYFTGRDANRGHCTQPCRWIYTLEEQKRPGVHIPIEQDGHGTSIMSSKDLCMIEHLDELAAAGVDSFKIEGRVKGAYYVATVVNAYRHVLDGEPAADYLSELDAVSHRPYHTGFYYGTPDQTGDADEYESTRIMVATVTDCQPADDGQWRVTFILRNRMRAGQCIEVLSPSQPIRSFELGLSVNENAGRVALANRAMEEYQTVCPFELHSGDILRRQREQGEDCAKA